MLSRPDGIAGSRSCRRGEPRPGVGVDSRPADPPPYQWRSAEGPPGVGVATHVHRALSLVRLHRPASRPPPCNHAILGRARRAGDYVVRRQARAWRMAKVAASARLRAPILP